MLPWKLRKRQILLVNQNLSSVYFSPAKFQLVSCNLSLAMMWQMTCAHKLPRTQFWQFSHLNVAHEAGAQQGKRDIERARTQTPSTFTFFVRLIFGPSLSLSHDAYPS